MGFYPLQASNLNEHAKAKRRISLKRLLALGASSCSYIELSQRVAATEGNAVARSAGT